MFANIGKKIKTLAKALCAFLAIASVIGGFYIIFTFGGMLGTLNSILLGVLIILVGSLLGWLSSLMLYAFGELVDNSEIIRDQLTGGAPAASQAQGGGSAFGAVSKAASQAVNHLRAPQAAPQQPQSAQPDMRGAYQPPQTTPAYSNVPHTSAFKRPGSVPPSQQPASLTGKSGWTQVDAQNIQCPNCRLVLPAEQAKRYGCCPQCRMPFQP